MSIVKCSHCGGETDTSTGSCAYCGTALTRNQDSLCPKCQNPLNPGATYCIRCGMVLNGMAPQGNVEPAPANVNTPQANRAPRPVHEHNASLARNNSGLYILYGALLFSIIACFLPFLSVKVAGITISVNFVSNENQTARGIYIVGMQVLALLLLFFRRGKIIPLLELGSIGVLVYQIYVLMHDGGIKFGELFDYFGIGFYLLAVSLIAALIFSTKECRY